MNPFNPLVVLNPMEPSSPPNTNCGAKIDLSFCKGDTTKPKFRENLERKVLRNGMDYEPKKTYPPDYSNRPTVRDWQMSPFSNERYELDEEQRWQKRGTKGLLHRQYLRMLHGDSTAPYEPPCSKCKARELEDKLRAAAATAAKVCAKPKVPPRNLYIPYGPAPVPSLVFPPPMPNTYIPYGPSTLQASTILLNIPEKLPPAPHPEHIKGKLCEREKYIPYGPVCQRFN